MKKLVFGLLLAAAIPFLLTSCNQDEDLPGDDLLEDVTASEDVSDAANYLLDIDEETEDAVGVVASRGGGDPSAGACPEITLEQPWGAFPNTITIDYGPDGCEGPKGHLRQGKILIQITDTLPNAGAQRIVTFEDFYVDGIKLEGTRTHTFEGKNALGQPVFAKTLEGGKLIFPNGKEVSWDCNHTATLIEGYDSPILIDNVWAIEGSCTGTGSNGNTYTSVITEPLIKKRACPWIVAGQREVTTPNGTRTIDYGDGSCDRFATVTLPDGTTKTIKIYRRWAP